MGDKSILFRQREDGTWEEKPEPYAVIECETKEDFNHIKQRLESTRWISVEERLPEPREDVLVCVKTGWILVGWYGFGGKRWHISPTDEGTLHEDIVAWMPLPEPYQGKNG